MDLKFGVCTNVMRLKRFKILLREFFLGINRYAPILSIQGDVGWMLSQTRVNLNILRYWNRLLAMENDRICKHVFLWDYQLQYNNWSCFVKDICEKLNMNNFEEKSLCDIDACIDLFVGIDNNEWYEKLSYKPKLRSYKLFKRNIYLERYVQYNLTCKERSLLAQIRMGILPINIETGRYKNISADKRFCYQCTTKIENEMHFMFECPVYADHRTKLFSCIENTYDFKRLDLHTQFSYLCTYYPRQLAKYVTQAFAKRQSILYESNS